MADSIKIVAHGATAEVYVDGKDVSSQLVGYEISHEAGNCPVVGLHYRYFPDEVKIDVDGEGGTEND
jgi:hypothetical protein